MPLDDQPLKAGQSSGDLVPKDRALLEVPAGEEEMNLAPLPLVLSASPGVSELMLALRRRWFAAFGGGLLLAGLVAAGVWFLMPEWYVARTLLHVAANRPFIFARDPVEVAAFENYQKTQMALAKSRFVLNAAMRHVKMEETKNLREEPDPILWLEKHLQVDFGVAPEILRISLSGDDQKELGILVNAVTGAYLTEIVNKENKDRKDRLDNLRRLYVERDNDLQDKVKRLKGLTDKTISPDPQTLSQYQRLQIEQVERARRELNEVVFKMKALQAEKDVLTSKRKREKEHEKDILEGKQKREGDPNLPEILIENQIDQDYAILQLKKEIAAAESHMEETKKTLSPGSKLSAGRLEKEQQALDDLQKRLATKRAEIRPKMVETLRETEGRKLEFRVLLLDDELLILKAREQDLTKVVEKLDENSTELKHAVTDLAFYQGRVNQAEVLVKKLADEIQKLELELEAPDRVRPLEGTAIVAPLYDAKRRILLTIGSSVAALGLVIMAVSWFESRRRRLTGVNELVQGLGIRVVATLPKVSQKPRAWLGRKDSDKGSDKGSDSYTQNIMAESVDAARTVLLHSARTEGIRVVMVTSAVSGEGKTSLASHLATSLARAGRRTLLVDADLRKPALHRVFDVPCEPGLGNLLVNEVGIDQVIQMTNVPDLWLVPAGAWNPTVAKALASERAVNAIVERFRQDFEFVIIDTCPVLAVVDPLLVGLHVDGVVLSVLRDISRLPMIFTCRERLASLGIRLLGAVMSGTSTEAYGAKYQVTSRSEQ